MDRQGDEMQFVIYDQPHETSDPNIWLIGFTAIRSEKNKSNLFHRGSRDSAQNKIDSYSVKKYKRTDNQIIKLPKQVY